MFEALLTMGDTDAVLVFPYKPEFIEQLKAAVPAADRTWDADKKQWTVKVRYVGELVSVAVDYWPQDTWTVTTDGKAGETVRVNAVTGQRVVQPHLFKDA